MRSLSRSLWAAAPLAMAAGLALSAGPGQAAAATAPAAASAPSADDIEPEAVQALKKMSAFLTTLNSFEVKADTTRDLVTSEGHRVQLTGVSDYKVRRPAGFVIDVANDFRNRRYYYDGKQFTVFAPTLGFYATAGAPATNGQTIDVLEQRYGIELPMDDLFRWNDPSSGQEQALKSAFVVGPSTVDGVATDHYAFREGDRDWQVWIQQGAQPVPRKLVIIDLSDEARPTYTARLAWTLNPEIAPATFTFQPPADAKAIHIATLEGSK